MPIGLPLAGTRVTAVFASEATIADHPGAVKAKVLAHIKVLPQGFLWGKTL